MYKQITHKVTDNFYTYNIDMQWCLLGGGCGGGGGGGVFFFNDTATTEIYTLSLHDALPICVIANQSRFISKT